MLRARPASVAFSLSAPLCDAVFSILESVAFDTGYAGSNGLEPQSWVNGNGTSYIYFGSGEFDGQGSGHDFYGTVSASLLLAGVACRVRPASTGLYVGQPRAGRTNAIVRARPERARGPDAGLICYSSFHECQKVAPLVRSRAWRRASAPSKK